MDSDERYHLSCRLALVIQSFTAGCELKVSGVRGEGSPFRVTVFNRLTAGTFQPLNPEP